jgi:alkanesulfonate monooxygenase SsuD/methylene tetrahydromethanopterin reductase-like flavin-dependent oxidoreductase (luciferase family)
LTGAVTNFGYTLMTEQSDPRQLVRDAQQAEAAGFSFEVMSDHYSPWLESQGHASYAWATLGAVTQVLRDRGLCVTSRALSADVREKRASAVARRLNGATHRLSAWGEQRR